MGSRCTTIAACSQCETAEGTPAPPLDWSQHGRTLPPSASALRRKVDSRSPSVSPSPEAFPRAFRQTSKESTAAPSLASEKSFSGMSTSSKISGHSSPSHDGSSLPSPSSREDVVKFSSFLHLLYPSLTDAFQDFSGGAACITRSAFKLHATLIAYPGDAGSVFDMMAVRKGRETGEINLEAFLRFLNVTRETQQHQVPLESASASQTWVSCSEKVPQKPAADVRSADLPGFEHPFLNALQKCSYSLPVVTSVESSPSCVCSPVAALTDDPECKASLNKPARRQSSGGTDDRSTTSISKASRGRKASSQPRTKSQGVVGTESSPTVVAARTGGIDVRQPKLVLPWACLERGSEARSVRRRASGTSLGSAPSSFSLCNVTKAGEATNSPVPQNVMQAMALLGLQSSRRGQHVLVSFCANIGGKPRPRLIQYDLTNASDAADFVVSSSTAAAIARHRQRQRGPRSANTPIFG